VKGWVYVISKKAMPKLVKVGHTMKDPELRAQELDHSGLPHRYIVEYELLIEDPRSIVMKAHVGLAHIAERKEWFRCSLEEAVATIRKAAKDYKIINEEFKHVDREKAERLRRKQKAAEARRLAELKRKREEEESPFTPITTREISQRLQSPEARRRLSEMKRWLRQYMYEEWAKNIGLLLLFLVLFFLAMWLILR
jgi:hypothetical protein